MTPAELALLHAAKARVEQKREVQLHEALRRSGARPDVPLHVFREGAAAAAEIERRTRTQYRIALDPTNSRETRLQAARVVIDGLPYSLAKYVEQPKRFKRNARRLFTDVARAVAAALEANDGKPRAQLGNRLEYVQQEDLDDLVPDGWGEQFAATLKALGRHHELPPRGIALLALLTWCSWMRPHSETKNGAGLQASIAWLARKLGCGTTWVKRCFLRLDPLCAWRRELADVRRINARRKKQRRRPLQEPEKPKGTMYMQRFRTLQRYDAQPQRDGARAPVWVDRGGRVRWNVDVRGRCYATPAGRALLIHRLPASAKEASPTRREEPLSDLERRLNARMGWRLRARLGGDVEPVEDPVEKFFALSTAPPRRRAAGA